MKFDSLKYAYHSRRNVVFAKKGGGACSTSPITSQVGLEIMKKGGNAIDAAVAMALTLPLTEPNDHGITVLMALNILKGLELGGSRESVETYHRMIKATKLAFADTKKYVSDPES